MAKVNEHVKNAVASAKQMAREQMAIIKRDSKRVSDITNKLTSLGVNVQHVSVDNYSFSVSVTGSKDDLAIVFNLMRREGYTPSWRPEEKQTYYASPWYTEDQAIKVWLNFSSTSCKRVQVGTEMKEVPVYETVCED